MRQLHERFKVSSTAIYAEYCDQGRRSNPDADSDNPQPEPSSGDRLADHPNCSIGGPEEDCVASLSGEEATINFVNEIWWLRLGQTT
jgi:hypothetical protein